MSATLFNAGVAVRSAIRAALIGSPEVVNLVAPDAIRAMGTTPSMFPSIGISDAQTILHGHEYSGQRLAWVYIDLHVWTRGDEDLAPQIGHAIARALDRPITLDGGNCTHSRCTDLRSIRDPDPEFGHVVVSVEALVGWLV